MSTKGEYILPAEWEPQEAVWLSWPLNPIYWPDLRDCIETDFARLVALISRYQKVRLNCLEPAQEPVLSRILTQGGVRGNIEIFNIPTDDAWCRDHGPIFLRHHHSGEVLVGDFPYNAWGGKFPAELDNLVPARIAEILGLPRLEAPLVLEGGSIDSNGAGLLLTTEACLLHPNRNPHLSQAEITDILQLWLGVNDIIWLGYGLEGDDTDGHIDDLSRFVGPRTVVTAIESRINDVNTRRLQLNRERLAAYRFPDGESLTIIDLPMPDAIADEDRRYPASYANFLILNDVVLVPTFDQKSDEAALRILKDIFPSREVLGFDCRTIIREGGAIHCLTMQQPAKSSGVV
jgi:agmatine deiminase